MKAFLVISLSRSLSPKIPGRKAQRTAKYAKELANLQSYFNRHS